MARVPTARPHAAGPVDGARENRVLGGAYADCMRRPVESVRRAEAYASPSAAPCRVPHPWGAAPDSLAAVPRASSKASTGLPSSLQGSAPHHGPIRRNCSSAEAYIFDRTM